MCDGVPETTPRGRRLARRVHRTRDRVLLTRHSGRVPYRTRSAKRKAPAAEARPSSESSPGGLRRTCSFPRLQVVAAHATHMRTHMRTHVKRPGCLSGAGHPGTLRLAPKAQAGHREVSGRQRPHCSYKQPGRSWPLSSGNEGRTPQPGPARAARGPPC